MENLDCLVSLSIVLPPFSLNAGLGSSYCVAKILQSVVKPSVLGYAADAQTSEREDGDLNGQD